MGEKMKQFLQKQSDKEADEILAQINADPEMANVHAPEEMEAALFARIDAYEKENAHRNLSEEDKELIELGKAYKKHKKRRKFTAVASLVLVGVMISGVTAMGGPEKVVEVVQEMILGRDRTYVDSKNDRVEEVELVSEEEAYERIEDEFGFTPVKMHYIPKGIVYHQCIMNKETQYVNLLYQGENDRIVGCEMWPNYNVSSIGYDVEDIFLDSYVKTLKDQEIIIKHYEVEESKEERWIVEFEENNIYYIMRMHNLNKDDVVKIIENLYFNN